MLKFYKDGKTLALLTDCKKEADLVEEFAKGLEELIVDGRFQDTENGASDWEFQLRGWIPQAFEIMLKLRGYKTTLVMEQTLYAVGDIFPFEKDDILTVNGHDQERKVVEEGE